jgi:hypothetical protein
MRGEKMTDEHSSLKIQVEQIAAKVEALTLKVDALSEKIALFSPGPALNGAASGDDDFPEPSEALLSWVGRSSLLQRLSTVCFLLVVALILRTVTDNGMVNLQLGYIIGMSYAAALMFMGWRRYRRANPLAPIFTVCGTILMFTIVVETHARFDALPSVPSYVLLMLTGLGTAMISYVYRVPAPVAAGNLGMCTAGAAIDYPNPFFPYLGIVLLTANLLGYFAARAHKYSWLRWILLLVTLFMINLWGIKLGMAALGGEKPPWVLAPDWFLPILTLFTGTYMLTAFFGIFRSLPGKISRFELALPTINVVWAFLLVQYVVFAMGGSEVLLGAIGAIAGAGHLTAGVWLAGREPKGARGANAFVFSGAVLLALALPLVVGSTLPSLPMLSAVAFWASIVSVKWHSGSVRLTSYLLQIYAAVALAAVLLGWETTPSFWVSVASAGGIACLGLLQYRWCRSRKPPEESAFFSRIDKGDFIAVAIFLAALLSAFFFLQVIVHRILAMFLAPADLNNAQHCSQSVIINFSAILLMFFALARRSRELRNVAILVTAIGAANVFLYDLLRAHGMPLVISVLSFGLATAVESVILGRWQRLSAPAKDSTRA